MNKKILIALLVAFAVTAVAGIVLFSLGCDHNWKPATCTKAETCTVCGETKASALGHKWSDATCTAPKTCTVCNITEGNALGHDWQGGSCTQGKVCALCGASSDSAPGHDWQGGSCTESPVCAVCGESYGSALGHDWAEATCVAPKTCRLCGVTEGQTAEHSFTPANCQAPETCKNCGITQGEPTEHNWAEATCTAPKTCLTCHQTEGEALPHDWKSATCQAPRTCNNCGLTEGDVVGHQWQKNDCEVPKTCIVCGETSGSATGHEWVEATCVTPKTCSICGKVSGVALGHNFITSADGSGKTCSICNETVKNKCVALTIDDGPSGDITKRLLEGLDARGARATFFICGYRIDTFPSYPQLIMDYGHEIGLHTDNHATLTRLDYNGIYKELADMYSQLPEGCNVHLMRPPGGAYNDTVKQVCQDLGLSVMLWSLDTKDWQTNDVDAIVQKIVNNAQNGSIILMHDLKSSSVDAALEAVDILQSMGYEFVTVSELAAIQGKPLEPGKVYTSLS